MEVAVRLVEVDLRARRGNRRIAPGSGTTSIASSVCGGGRAGGG